ncbi:MAG: ring-cleaving dioxygenase [Balneolaceae bacterium]|nr:ring-cleaving dioxygenase [Balneolaceae bacterium]MCH8548524.1 ring-cleaving dioxygenase [Balneolaceae bacterium]
MSDSIKGLHHITAVSGPPQENFNFYRNKLGLRFTKKTINFDDPFTYHLYYGNHNATPGSTITFFPWQNVPNGSPSTGEATIVDYAIPGGSADYWYDRLKELNIKINRQKDGFGFETISFHDNDGMKIRLVADSKSEKNETKGYGTVPDEHAVRGFFGTTLSLADTGRTAELLKEMGWSLTGEADGAARFGSAPENNLGRFVDLKKEPELNGRFGRGSIHHIAFRVPDDGAQQNWREKIKKMGFSITPVKNRDYFRSIYFREAGGVLFEIATDIPGFDVDEPFESLGEELKLPAWFEQHREEIERRLPELNTD